jgi:hypothetical protein
MSGTMRLQILLQAIDRVSGPMRETTRRIEGIGTAGRRASDAMSRLGASAGLARMASVLGTASRNAAALALSMTRVARNSALIGAGVTAAAGYGFARGPLRRAGEFEQMRIAMRVQENGSQARADDNLRWIEDYSTRTTFTFREVFDNFVRMQNSGLNPRDYMRAVGNAASGTRKPLEQAIEAFNDAVGGEFERLREFGIRASRQGNRATLQWQEGETMMRERDIDAQNPRAIAEALRRIFDRRFPNMQEEQSRSYFGRISNLEDAWEAFERAVMGSGVFAWVNNELQRLLDKVNELRDNGTLDRWAQQVGAAMISGFQGVRDFLFGYEETVEDMGVAEAPLTRTVPGAIERLRAFFGEVRQFWTDTRAAVETIAGIISSTLDKVERHMNNLRAFFSLPSLIPQMLGGTPVPAGAAAGGGTAPAPLAPSFSEGPLGRLLGAIGDAVGGGSGAPAAPEAATEPATTPRDRRAGNALRRRPVYGDAMMPDVAEGGRLGPRREDVRVNAGIELMVRAEEGLRVQARQNGGDPMDITVRRGTLEAPMR